MKARFEGSQSLVVKGTMLIPACVITKPDWISQIQPCVDMYIVDLPSKRTLNAELDLWEQKWTKDWEERWKKLQQQHIEATGEHLVVTPSELKKLKQNGVPSNISATLIKMTPEFSPNIYSLLTTLAVLPVTNCEAERCISCLRRLKLTSGVAWDKIISQDLLYSTFMTFQLILIKLSKNLLCCIHVV